MPKITVSPTPVNPGDFVTICYVPVTGGAAYMDIHFDLDGGGETGVGVRVTTLQPCVEIQVPADADQGIVSDSSGAAQDALIVIT